MLDETMTNGAVSTPGREKPGAWGLAAGFVAMVPRG